MNHYQVLGVKETATADEIKSAYRRLATQYHPDKNPDNKEAEEKIKTINLAYDTLKDPNKKSKYDLSLQMGQSVPSGGFYSHRYTNIPEEILKEIFPNGQAFETFFRMGGFPFESKVKETKNRDVHITLNITIQDAFKGTEKIAQVKEGMEVKTISIEIPKGVRSGMRLRVKDQAPRQNLNLPSGDLIVQLNIQNSNDFTVVNDNLISVLKVSPLDAILGSKIEFKNIDEELLSVEVPAGTRHTEYVKIEGKGMTFINSDKRSDLLLQVQTTPLENLPDRLKKRLQKLNNDIKKK
jgi:curved DNA-binding protein